MIVKVTANGMSISPVSVSRCKLVAISGAVTRSAGAIESSPHGRCRRAAILWLADHPRQPQLCLIDPVHPQVTQMVSRSEACALSRLVHSFTDGTSLLHRQRAEESAQGRPVICVEALHTKGQPGHDVVCGGLLCVSSVQVRCRGWRAPVRRASQLHCCALSVSLHM